MRYSMSGISGKISGREEDIMKKVSCILMVSLRYSLSGLILLLFISTASGQYFGRNKPSYRVFDFKVLQTPDFEIYHYSSSDSLLKMFAERSEAWYRHHQVLFRDTIKERNPILLYENHAEFQQTTAVSGLIGESTGGVTEALKNRIVMPLSPSFAQTDHVLGHEMVHAFQFNIFAREDDSVTLSLSKLSNLPLWMVEGMAEYFSIGSIDPHTAMWMRDAVLTNDIPSLKDMTVSNKYFPYRYGQAVMAMIGKTWGDSVIVPLFRETAINGYDKAIKNVLGIGEKEFSRLWQETLKNGYKPFLSDTLDRQTGRKLLTGKSAGKVNLSPSVSHNGRYVTFLSERDVYTLDLYLADASTGKILRKLSSRVNNNEVDALNFLESSGTWSPDSRQFAFVVFSEGRNKLVIMDVEKTKVIRETELTGLPEINNPSWSPDGRHIVISAMKEGITDLYLYEVSTNSLTRLTDDVYTNLQPSWSPDGKHLVYVTDKPLPGQAENFRQDYSNIAVFNVEGRYEEALLPLFAGARNMNPLYSPDGENIFFLSDRDGFRNLYEYNLSADTISQMTKYMRGITGITAYSPAVSVARESGDIVYSYYSDKSYTIFIAGIKDFAGEPVSRNDIDYRAATLPPMEYKSQSLVDSSLLSDFYSPDIPAEEIKPVPYKPRFKLDYLSNSSVGVAAGRMGTGMTGSINAIFGDMTGDNQLFTALSLNGEIYDFGGQIAYINQKRKLKWGASLSHIPNYFGSMSISADTLSIGGEPFPASRIDLNYIRMFEDKASVFAFYPLSQSRRFEFSGDLAGYSYRLDMYSTWYDIFGTPLGARRKKMEAPGGFALATVSAAYVVDNSTTGITGPVNGTRYRLEAGKYFGKVNFVTTLADYRKYFQVRPLTLAFRSYNYGRWGEGASNGMVAPLYIGYPWLIRGYQRMVRDISGFENSNGNFGIDNFFGNKMFVTNFEVRIPFSGPGSIFLIKSDILFTDLNIFFDGGLVLDNDSRLASDWVHPGPGERVPMFSYGISLRLNLFGYAVIEPFYAVPVINGSGIGKGSFGVNLSPGW